MKTIGFMPRKPGTSRAAFRDYYETGHVALALPRFPFTRYRRNHLADQEVEPGFDCLSEFWIDTIEPIIALMAGEVGDTMRADERSFADQPNIRSAVVEEALPSPADATTIVLLKGTGDMKALIDLLRPLGTGLDLLKSSLNNPLPCDAIVTLPPAVALPDLPSGWSRGAALAIERRETDPATLLGNR